MLLFCKFCCVICCCSKWSHLNPADQTLEADYFGASVSRSLGSVQFCHLRPRTRPRSSERRWSDSRVGPSSRRISTFPWWLITTRVWQARGSVKPRDWSSAGGSASAVAPGQFPAEPPHHPPSSYNAPYPHPTAARPQSHGRLGQRERKEPSVEPLATAEPGFK